MRKIVSLTFETYQISKKNKLPYLCNILFGWLEWKYVKYQVNRPNFKLHWVFSCFLIHLSLRQLSWDAMQ